jgi:amino acid permease
VCVCVCVVVIFSLSYFALAWLLFVKYYTRIYFPHTHYPQKSYTVENTHKFIQKLNKIASQRKERDTREREEKKSNKDKKNMSKRKREDDDVGFKKCQELLTFLVKHKESGKRRRRRLFFSSLFS